MNDSYFIFLLFFFFGCRRQVRPLSAVFFSVHMRKTGEPLKAVRRSDYQKSPEPSKSVNKKEMFYGIRRLDFAFRIFDQAYRFCHCEEGAIFAPDAAIFNDAICHPETKYGYAE